MMILVASIRPSLRGGVGTGNATADALNAAGARGEAGLAPRRLPAVRNGMAGGAVELSRGIFGGCLGYSPQWTLTVY